MVEAELGEGAAGVADDAAELAGADARNGEETTANNVMQEAAIATAKASIEEGVSSRRCSGKGGCCKESG